MLIVVVIYGVVVGGGKIGVFFCTGRLFLLL